MTSIKLIVSGASARAEVDGLLTSGMVGIPVTIVCDGAWDGLTKSMVCRAGHIVKTILNVGNTATVAHECMVPNQTLLIGIEGRNADGTLVIPTIWARCGLICSGANADADPSTDPTLPVWARIESKIGSLDNLNTEAKDNLVAAINEVWASGGGGTGASVTDAAINKDGHLIITLSTGKQIDAGYAVGPAGPQGEKGDKGDTGTKGDKGTDGKSAYQYAQEGGYTGTEAEFAAKLAEEMPDKLPNPNALTFTGAVTGSYDGSAPLEVAIPSGEGGTGGGGDVFELIGEATSSGVSDVAGLTIPFDGSLYKNIIAYAYNLPAGNGKRIIIRSTKAWHNGCPLGLNGAADTYNNLMTGMKNTWGFFGAAIDVGGKLFTLGAAESNANGGHAFFRFFPQNGALPTLSLSDCKFISLDCNSNSEMLPDGCSLIVWGVRK